MTWDDYGEGPIAPQMIQDSLQWVKTTGHGSEYVFYKPGSAVFTGTSALNNKLYTESTQFTIKAGNYTKAGFAKVLTDLMQNARRLNQATDYSAGTAFLQRTDDAKFNGTGSGQDLYFTECGHRPVDSNTKNYQYYDTGGAKLSEYWFGASQMALIWDPDTNQFAWQYFHTPYGVNNQMGVAIFADATPKYSTVTEASGVFFWDLEPRSLFEDQLGFNYDDLIVTFDLGTGSNTSISRDQLVAKTTHGFFPMQSFFSQFNRKVNPPTDGHPEVSEESNTQMIKATNIYSTANSGGFYLIEVSFTGKKNYYYGKNVNGAIQGIVSNYSAQNNYITGYADAGVQYIHSGAPFNLNNFHIRILSPITKLPVTTLGDSSYVFIQVDKNGASTVQQNKSSRFCHQNHLKTAGKPAESGG